MEPPPQAPPPGFALPTSAWAAATICASAPLAGALNRAVSGQLTWQAFAGALAVAAAFVAVPTAAAWLVWRVARQRKRLRDGVFFVALGLLAFGLARHAIDETRARRAAAKAQAETLARQLVQRETNRATAADTAAAAPHGVPSALTQPILDAQRAVKARLDAVQLNYDVAVDAIAPDAFFDLTPLRTREAIATRRAHVEAFARANQLQHEAASLGAFYFSSELRDRAVPEDTVREAVSVYRAATKKHLPRMKRLRDKDGALVLLMRQFLEFAEAQHGRWRVDESDGALAFEDPAAKDRYDEILRVARVLQNDRQHLRQELLRAQP